MKRGFVPGLLWLFIAVGCSERADDAKSPAAPPLEYEPTEELIQRLGSDPCVLRVKPDAHGPPDGLSWSTAFDRIEQAIGAARAGIAAHETITRCDVWVAQGTYYVFRRSRMDTLQMAENVHLYGGFNGTEDDLAGRDFKKHETIIDGRDSQKGNDSVYHVVTGANNAVLDGFTIARGNAIHGRHGGGMYNDQVSPTVRNCIFKNNNSDFFGGAVFNHRNKPDISGCVFKNNTARFGGAIMNQETPGQISATVFMDNHASKHGGALFNHSRVSTTIVNSVFVGNRTKGHGAGAYNLYKADAKFAHCTFFKNYCKKDKISAVYAEYKSRPTVVNSIVWDNGPTPVFEKVRVSYSIVQHGFKGEGNKDKNPRLSMRKDGTYTLAPGSPCIDAANGKEAPPWDMTRKQRIDDPGVEDAVVCEPGATPCVPHADMGAIEYEPETRPVEPDTDSSI